MSFVKDDSPWAKRVKEREERLTSESATSAADGKEFNLDWRTASLSDSGTQVSSAASGDAGADE